MSLTITINNIDDLTDKERAVLRYILDGAQPAITLQETIRALAAQQETAATAIQNAEQPPWANSAPSTPAAPVEPSEVFSPHTTVIPAPSPSAVIPAPVPSGSAELDANGLPWDKRIHSSSRAKVADGTWRMMRGVDAALVATVEAELRAVQAIPVPVMPLVNVDGGGGADMSVTVSNAALPLLPAPSVPAPPAPTGPMTFVQLMQHITPMLISGKLDQPKLQGIVGTLGLPHLAALGARPDLVETVRAAIDEAMQ